MKGKHRVLLLLLLFITPSLSKAGTPELLRPVVSELEGHAVEVWFQQDYSTPSVDFMNYANKSGTTSKLTRYSDSKLGFRYAISDDLNIRYQVGYGLQDISRKRKPKSIKTSNYSHDLKFQCIVYRQQQLRLAIEAGYRAHKAKDANFYDYQQGIFTLTRGGLPLLTINSKDNGWNVALRGSVHFSQNWTLHTGFEMRKITIHATMLSQDSLVQSLLASTAPQSTPWDETHLLLQMALNWHASENINLAMDLIRYQINRSGYQPNPKKVDYNTQNQLDGYLTWDFNKSFTVYAHGRVSSNFLLGDIPMSYNRRVNHTFKNPYGFISMGMNISF